MSQLQPKKEEDALDTACEMAGGVLGLGLGAVGGLFSAAGELIDGGDLKAAGKAWSKTVEKTADGWKCGLRKKAWSWVCEGRRASSVGRTHTLWPH